MNTRVFFLTALSALTLAGCADGPQLKPNVSGKAGEVIVVWIKATGKQLPSVFALAFGH
jgi:hypothetical protein